LSKFLMEEGFFLHCCMPQEGSNLSQVFIHVFNYNI